jgi:hypothetical protein
VNFKAVRVAKVKPPKPAKPAPAAAQDWVEIELKDSAGKPLGFETYRVVASDGRVIEGTLDSQGKARVLGVKQGQCKITFPDLHADHWK